MTVLFGSGLRFARCLLLGTVAGLFATGSAQSADSEPAKTGEYVKVCTLYGAGFWYVPGTDTCLKVGGYVRAQVGVNGDGNEVAIGAPDRLTGSLGGHFDRVDTNYFSFRSRGLLSADVRTQTEYGTLRSYMNIGAQWTTSANGGGANVPNPDTIYVSRAFVQFAGFSAGRIRSFFDIIASEPYAIADPRSNNQTDKIGIFGVGYTWQFGAGLSGTLAFEDGGWATGGRGRSTVNLSTGAGLGSTTPAPFTIAGETNDNSGQVFLDPVLALRIDQAWGFGQLSGALHDASGGNYVAGPGSPPGCAPTVGSLTGTNPCGHPGDKWGFATAAGFSLNNAFGQQSDTLGAQAVFSQGATGYATKGAGPWSMYSSDSKVGLGWLVDGIFANGSAVELTQAWSLFGGYQHVWTPKWKTSLYGGVAGVNYDSAAKNLICGGAGGPSSPLGFTTTPGGVGAFTPGTVSNCNPNFSWTELGTRTMWNPVPDVDIGVDVLWTHFNTAFGGAATLPASGGRPPGAYNISNQDALSAFFRFQRNFLY
jgi:hypothetical protein